MQNFMRKMYILMEIWKSLRTSSIMENGLKFVNCSVQITEHYPHFWGASNNFLSIKIVHSINRETSS